MSIQVADVPPPFALSNATETDSIDVMSSTELRMNASDMTDISNVEVQYVQVAQH